jgi:hypothetical protein
MVASLDHFIIKKIFFMTLLYKRSSLAVKKDPVRFSRLSKTGQKKRPVCQHSKSGQSRFRMWTVFISQLVKSLVGINWFVWICLFVCQNKQGKRGDRMRWTIYI